MKHLLLIALGAILLISCGPDEDPIQKEMKEKAGKLDGLDIAVYKTFKLTARGGIHLGDVVSDYSSAPQDSTQKRSVWSMISDFEHTEVGQVVSYAAEHRDEILETDEDQHPTIWESIDDQGEFFYNEGAPPIEITSSHEHLAFAIIMAGAFQSFNNFSLYECEHIDNQDFKQEDWNILSRTFRAVQYTMSDWQYLAEQECTIGLEELESAELDIVFLSDQKHPDFWSDTYQAMFHCLRALARYSMDDEDKKEQATADIIESATLFAKHDQQPVLIALSNASVALENGDTALATKELQAALDYQSIPESLSIPVAEIIKEIGRGEIEKAERHVEVLLHSRPLVVHCLDEFLDHMGVYDAIANTKAGQQYYQIIENIESWQNKVGSWIDPSGWLESSKNFIKAEADSLKSAITD